MKVYQVQDQFGLQHLQQAERPAATSLDLAKS